jgi:hypothetical protein
MKPSHNDADVRFDERFLEQYTGRALLHDPASAIVELVANAWDAGAPTVKIDWPRRSGEFVRVIDSGQGMTADQFMHRWLTLAYDRTKEQPSLVNVVGMIEERRVFGQNGMGRFAAFCFGPEYVVSTVSGGRRSIFRVRRGIEKPIIVEQIGDETANGSGTAIEVKHDGSIPLKEDTIRSEIGKRFLTDPSFNVSVNGVKVDFEDIGETGIERFLVPVDGLASIDVLLIDAEQTDRSTKQHGVAWHVNQRLVGDCTWHGNGLDDLVDGRRIEARRYTFIVFAEPLAGTFAVKPDWRGFNEDDETYKKVRAAIVPALREKLLGLTKERRAETTQEVRRANAKALQDLTLLSREKWNEFVDQVQETCPSLSQPELELLGGILANLELSHSKYGLLRKLNGLAPDQFDDLNKIFEDWTIDTAKAVLDELQARLTLVDQMQRKTENSKTLEVQELQPLFHQGLWIFGPEFETIEFTSNRGMTKVIQDLFHSQLKGSRLRPDFVILPDGSLGLYSYPKYDEYGGEIGVDRLVIVELKKPEIAVSEGQKTQCWKYVKELYEKGLLSDGARVDCYVLGSKVDQNERDVRTEKDGRVRIHPMDFGVVLTRAKSRLLKLFDRVKAAPFLKEQEMAAYLNPNIEPQGELPLARGSIKVTAKKEPADK